MKIYFDQNSWHKIFDTYTVDEFKEKIKSENLEVYIGQENIYEFGRLFLDERANKESIERIFCYLSHLADFMSYIKEPKELIIDDFKYVAYGSEVVPFLDFYNTELLKQEISRISQGYFEKGKSFIAKREENINKDSLNFVEKVKSSNPKPQRNIEFEEYRDNWGMRRKILNIGIYSEIAKQFNDLLLFKNPNKHPFINTEINAQIYINFAVHSKGANPLKYTSDFRHIICANSAGNFVTMDKKLINIGRRVCPYINIFHWNEFYKIKAGK